MSFNVCRKKRENGEGGGGGLGNRREKKGTDKRKCGERPGKRGVWLIVGGRPL